MCYRDPIDVFDQTLENLRYLRSVLCEDVDSGALHHDRLAARAIKAASTLKAIDALLPRLRVARSNHEVMPRLPDAAFAREFFASGPSSDHDDAREASALARHIGGIR